MWWAVHEGVPDTNSPHAINVMRLICRGAFANGRLQYRSVVGRDVVRVVEAFVETCRPGPPRNRTGSAAWGILRDRGRAAEAYHAAPAAKGAANG